jgi:hypothetical protein
MPFQTLRVENAAQREPQSHQYDVFGTAEKNKTRRSPLLETADCYHASRPVDPIEDPQR